MKQIKTLLAASISLILLAGCNSDDSKDNVEKSKDPINQAPIIILNNAEGVEKQIITITASVQDEGEVTYLWSQNSGALVSLENTKTNTVSFVAPSVTENIKISLNLTVEDEEGLTSSQDVEVEVKQQFVSLTLNGVATDSPLMDATIKATMGEHNFTTTTDSDGTYTLELNVDDDTDMSQLITIEAQGKDDQKEALLQSKLMSFESLKAKAGNDAVLTSDENFGVNVTNLTTAKSALISRENLYKEVETEQDLIRLRNEINAEELVKVATAIKVVLDKSSNNQSLSLPDGITNVLELALNNEKMTQYIKDIEQTPEFTQAKEEMLADEKVVQKPNANGIDTFYYSRGNLYINQVVELNNDGTGQYLLNAFDGTFKWTYSDGIYTLENPEGFYVNESISEVNIDGEVKSVIQKASLYKSELKILSATDNGFIVSETEYTNISYPNGEYDDYQLIDDSIFKVITQAQQVDFTLAQTEFPISLPGPNILIEDVVLGAMTVSLNDDGTGKILELGDTNASINWQLIDDKGKKSLQITLNDYDNQSIIFKQLSDNEGVIQVAVVSEFYDKKYARVGFASLVNESEVFSLETVPGIYSYNFDGKSLEEFWFELWPDGKAVTMSVSDTDNDGELSADESKVFKGNWKLENDVLTITRNLNDYNGCYYIGYDFACWQWNTRQWKLIEQIEDTIYVNHMHQFTYNQGEEPREKTFDNRKFNKASERPILAPLADEILQQIGYQPPIALKGLVSFDTYLDKRLYFVNFDYYQEGEVGYFQFNTDESFEFYQDDQLSTGNYQLFADNQAVLRDNISFNYGKSYGLLAESSNVLITAFDDSIWPQFSNETDAKVYISTVTDNKPVSTIDHLLNRKIYMVDRGDNSEWHISFLQFDKEKVKIYSDESFSVVQAELDYSVTEEGMMSISGNSLFLSLVTDAFNIVVTNVDENDTRDFNYFLFEHQKAIDFVQNANVFQESSTR
ncbi:hypothetical protein AT00_10395 [Pseudoalteromonas lipolytica SCSIO 04301]|uniref:hypothetical protein n=1 Tax=Pseudoalteromonas lipolytica TaxID=570156 RepID=UPI0004503BEC|nr:hypothetical protein [Pseudoalteromonas lipolytica]EWH06665.1 hypothetical protein AT00_10395 [Pseudoalteromonas lipolytica SCSIO 04301]